MPPVSTFANTIDLPSGENDGSISSPESDVIRAALPPPSGCTQISKLFAPALSEAYATRAPSGESAGSMFKPDEVVTLTRRARENGSGSDDRKDRCATPTAPAITRHTNAVVQSRRESGRAAAGAGAIGAMVLPWSLIGTTSGAASSRTSEMNR